MPSECCGIWLESAASRTSLGIRHLSALSLETTNRYAEVDLEMKAKALQTCAGDALGRLQDCSPSWHSDGELMNFLASL